MYHHDIHPQLDRESGQATTEYALILVAAAVIAAVVITAGPKAIEDLFATVVRSIGGKIR